METKEKMALAEKPQRKKKGYARWRSNLIWSIFVFLLLYIFFSGFIESVFFHYLYAAGDRLPDSVFYIIDSYTYTLIPIAVLFLVSWLIPADRYIWKSFLLPRKNTAAEMSESDTLAEFYGRGRNGLKMLGWGLLLGFITNFFGIACALIHGDIKLYFDAELHQLPVFLFALFSVCLQSSSEELWCRGYLYERLHDRYPLWVAIAANGILFGLLHSFNDGASVLSITDIAICGISYSLLRWYTGNIWIAMGLHTGWNFTQAFLFGLPNSGMVSKLSLFHLHASTGINNLVYDYTFGVEGGLPALIADLMVGVAVVVLAARRGRLGELKMDRAKTLEAANMSLGGESCAAQ